MCSEAFFRIRPSALSDSSFTISAILRLASFRISAGSPCRILSSYSYSSCWPRFITAFRYRSSKIRALPKWASVSAAMIRLCQYMLSVETVSVVPLRYLGNSVTLA